MGGAERVNRRKVLTGASDAVAKTNDLVGRYNECVRAIGALGDQIDSLNNELTVYKGELADRLSAQGKWLERVEKDIEVVHRDAQGRMNGEVKLLNEKLDTRTPASNTFLGRLRWLLGWQ